MIVLKKYHVCINSGKKKPAQEGRVLRNGRSGGETRERTNRRARNDGLYSTRRFVTRRRRGPGETSLPPPPIPHRGRPAVISFEPLNAVSPRASRPGGRRQIDVWRPPPPTTAAHGGVCHPDSDRVRFPRGRLPPTRVTPGGDNVFEQVVVPSKCKWTSGTGESPGG